MARTTSEKKTSVKSTASDTKKTPAEVAPKPRQGRLFLWPTLIVILVVVAWVGYNKFGHDLSNLTTKIVEKTSVEASLPKELPAPESEEAVAVKELAKEEPAVIQEKVIEPVAQVQTPVPTPVEETKIASAVTPPPAQTPPSKEYEEKLRQQDIAIALLKLRYVIAKNHDPEAEVTALKKRLKNSPWQEKISVFEAEYVSQPYLLEAFTKLEPKIQLSDTEIDGKKTLKSQLSKAVGRFVKVRKLDINYKDKASQVASASEAKELVIPALKRHEVAAAIAFAEKIVTTENTQMLENWLKKARAHQQYHQEMEALIATLLPETE